MSDNNSLTFLADVALQNFYSISFYRNQKVSKLKKLSIIRINGEDMAELNDLKSLPISFLSRIFVEKFEDKKLRYITYICKFGVQSCCNTKFKDNREGKVQRMEHLIQCHLLQHLIKTKSDAMIKIPKKSTEFAKIYFQVAEFMPPGDPLPNLNQQHDFVKLLEEKPKNGISSDSVIEMKDGYESYSNKLNFETLGNCTVTEAESEEKNKLIRINSSENTSQPQLINNGLTVSKPLTVNHETNRNCAEKCKVDIAEDVPPAVANIPKLVEKEVSCDKLVSDHSYAAVYANKVIPIPCRSSKFRRANHNVNIDHLYYFNSEPSLELSDFMMFETLQERVRNAENELDELPLIGSEVEITSDDTVAIPVDLASLQKDDRRVLSSSSAYKENRYELKRFKKGCASENIDLSLKEITSNEENKTHCANDQNNNHFCESEENYKSAHDLTKRRNSTSILKSTLQKLSKSDDPVVNISNIWNNINVQRM